jgi:hypothetical protein
MVIVKFRANGQTTTAYADGSLRQRYREHTLSAQRIRKLD